MLRLVVESFFFALHFESLLCLLPSCRQVESIEAAMLMQRRARKQLRRDGSFRTQAVALPLPTPLN